MKKKIVVVLIVLMALCMFCLTSCEEKTQYYETFYDNYNLSEYVTLYDFSSFDYTLPEIEVTDEEVNALLEEKLAASATETQLTSGVVKDGDKVNIAFHGTLKDGSTLDGMNTDSYTLTIGTTSMIDGFAESIIGKNVGEEYSVNLKFPDPYTSNTDLSGMPVTFKIRVNSIFVKETPVLDEKWVKENSDKKSVDEYMESLRNEVYESKKGVEVDGLKQQLFSAMREGSKVSEPISDIVDKEIAIVDKMLKAQATINGQDWDTFLSEEMQMTKEEYDANVRKEANEVVELDMILYAACQQESIKVLQSEVDELVNSMLSYSGMDANTFEKTYGVSPVDFIHYMSYDYQLFASKLLDQVFEKNM